MLDSEDGHPRGKRALGMSVLLHVCAAPLFVVIFAGAPIPEPETVSVTNGAFALTLQHRAAPRAPTRLVPSKDRLVAHVASAMVPDRTTQPRVVTRAFHAFGTPTHAPPRIAIAIPTDPPSPKPTPTQARRQGGAPSANSDSTEPKAAPTDSAESATPEPSATSVALARALEPAPVGGWGQNFRDPTLLDDNAVALLRAHYHGARVRVDVDEDGHATKVTVEDNGLDADARAAIEKTLSAIRYVPAECNGLRCAASLEIRV
jgi:hypothetical protein